MKKLLLFIAIMCGIIMNAQKTVILEHEGVSTAFNGASPFEEAYEAAVSGDIVYLPGGAIVPPATIDKGIKIYGVGHHPEATDATLPTYLSSTINLNENADGFYLEGVEINGNISIAINHTVDDVSIIRCKFGQFYINSNTGTLSNNFLIRECILTNSIVLTGGTGIISNSILQSTLSSGKNVSVNNCIFLYEASDSSEPIRSIDNSTIANCIFLKNDYGIQESCDGTTFTNNVFKVAPSEGNNSFVNSYINAENIFVDQTGNVFDFAHDYGLSGTYATDYLGTDGEQVGIYGGLFPFKSMSVPSTPHISSQSIAGSTDNDGNLSISITVEAQDN